LGYFCEAVLLEEGNEALMDMESDSEMLLSAQYMTMLNRPKTGPGLSSVLGVREALGRSGAPVAAFTRPGAKALLSAGGAAHKPAEKSRAAASSLASVDSSGPGEEDQVARIALSNLDFTEYVGPIGLGTISSPKGCSSLAQTDSGGNSVSSEQRCKVEQQQTLNVVFDTGSTNLWIASTLCTKGSCVSNGRHRFNMKESETFNQPANPQNLAVEFGTANLSGTLGMDNFHIGPFTVRNQTFALIKQESGGTFNELPLEGIVGLAFPSLMDRMEPNASTDSTSSTGISRPFFDSVIEQKVLKRNMFAFYLSPPESDASAGSFVERAVPYHLGMDAILWGGVDKRLYEGELSWFPVTQAHYWAIDLHGFSIGNESVQFEESKPLTAQIVDSILGDDTEKAPAKLIIDSGTTYYTAESHVYNSLVDRAPCDESAVLPDLTYRIKDIHGQIRSIVLSPKDYVAANCELGFLQIDIPKKYGPAMLLGELFMRKYFTVFDRGDGSDTSARIGIARARKVSEIRQALEMD
jgi:pepsin A